LTAPAGCRVVVFDFDGTLVQSNELKKSGFREMFEVDDPARRLVDEVLLEHPEQSRYVILRQLQARLHSCPCEDVDNAEVQQLASRYDAHVRTAVKLCPEMPGASAALAELSAELPVYLSSNTPEEALQDIVSFRGWNDYFRSVRGYPHEKVDTLRAIVARHGCSPGEVVVVGDGDSDRRAAVAVGAHFCDVSALDTLTDLKPWIEHGETG